MRSLACLVAIVTMAVPLVGRADDAAVTSHGLAMHGDLKYPAGFKHFDYVEPDAPKGGEIKLGAVGTSFDTFNGFVVKGVPAVGLSGLYDTLMVASADEPFSEYCLLAESVTVPSDRSSVTFTLRANARFHDGKPVTPDDVIWTFDTLRTKGLPYFRAYYAAVDRVEETGERAVKFTFKSGDNRELPLIVGQLPVLPKHYWETRDFEKTTLDPPVGSGPYKIDSFEPGRQITYRRVADYWGKDLPVNVGRDNFDVMHHDYYRDDTVALEALKAGEFDFRVEASSKYWATAYDTPAISAGTLLKREVPNDRPAGMQGYVFNVRRPLFQDRRVRQALAYAFDFEWSNKSLFYGQYKRSRSFFDNSELAATGLPSAAELAVLEPYRDRLPSEVFTTEYQPPKTDGSGNLRENLRAASELLKQAGWDVDPKTKKLARDGKPFRFEILLVMPLFERITLPFAKNLERLGIEASVRTVDTSQYQKRLEQFDYDMVVDSINQSNSPGNEQRLYWGSAYADQPGSDNRIGLKDAVVDAIIEKLVAAPDRASLVAHVKALDRVLQWGFWVIPQWHIPYDRIAYWDKFGMPKVTPSQGVQFDTWWVDPAKAATLDARRKR